VVTYRVAVETDLAELAAMRWQFRLEEAPGMRAHDREGFLSACETFLRQGLCEGRWTYWMAEADGEIVSHIFVQRVAKVPKPNRLEASIGFMTNVYTRPGYRNQGIGTHLMRHVLLWADEQNLESLVVWPSAASLHFYERAGFRGGSEVLEYEVRAHVT
jgi:GNAT superfamily N-acetyltransferase